MAVKKLNSRKNWVGSEVASVKIAFFAIFSPIWTHIVAPTGLNMGFLTHNFNFQPLDRKDISYISTNYVTLGLT